MPWKQPLRFSLKRGDDILRFFFLLEFFGVVVETGVSLVGFAVAEAGYVVSHCCCCVEL